ncbi:4-(cytidine 5'-diphospho)-2-C-methyl-D-erythritol kinase [Chelatococcus reniformis]|uniref:4-diphosphocytidyl-2-C-methyl-D-erythritol kinase n=1 Tax=Chelatococcus reniformis TaxID=1494448 RepID=A0A916U810_9HYPH|nr:4-(cytidine 5'-diphospho)-2-C-methyl-D-erythritol kinase [Chelatococcus reniformis]GGC62582.1 4-diphosphocytidyl-2-C-methyl-D-erythritol kinase [Chelatococcus reniformis]
MLSARASAKVNLTLHVHGRRADGYHELESLVAFAGVGDRLTLTPASALTLHVDGPGAAAAGPADANLVYKAARALQRRQPGLALGAFALSKHLPVAAGLGGGSADAAAALRLLANANALPLDHADIRGAARATGADVPVCLTGKARMMRGIGDELGPAVALPLLFAVLVNPGVALATSDVFRALAAPPLAGAQLAAAVEPPAGGPALLRWLLAARNDLEPPALGLCPQVGQALAALREAAGCRLARMSGSGATVFGLFDDCRAAAAAARAIRVAQPAWWVKPTVLR